MSTLPDLYVVPGSGAMICEVAFEMTNVAFNTIDLTWDDVGWHGVKINKLNVLGQIPIVVFPSGEVLTESSAILQWLHSKNPSAGLIVDPSSDSYLTFLRWFAFLNTAVYPTFTYGDVPTRWVNDDEDAAELLRKGTDSHRQKLFRTIEKVAKKPYFLGDSFCSIDLYLWLMTYWRPKKEWFAQNCPKIHAIAECVEQLPEAIKVSKRNFPDT